MRQVFYKQIYYQSVWGVRDQVVRVVDLGSLAFHRCGFESRQGHWNFSCEEALKLDGSTQVHVHA